MQVASLDDGAMLCRQIHRSIAIASDAGVDAALVSHFFGSKQRLFVEVVELPFEPETVIPAMLTGDRETVGLRLARFALALLENPDARDRMLGLVRAAASEPEAGAMVRDLLTSRVFEPIAEALEVDDAQLRANLVGSQTVGLVMARCVVAVEPLASLPADVVVAAIAPTFQRYLTGPLS